MESRITLRRAVTALASVAIADAARTYDRASRAPNTQRMYRVGWASFEAWTEAQSLVSLPAAPETVRLYVAALGLQGRASKTIALYLTAISQAHQLAGYSSPTASETVRTTLKGLRRTITGTTREAKPLTWDLVRRIVRKMDASLLALRNRTILLLGVTGGFRRSELVALQVPDLSFDSRGLVVTVRRSKTDQEGRGRRVAIANHANPLLCPVQSLQTWLELAEIKRGPIFRSVSQWGAVGTSALGDRAISEVVKAAVELIGLDPTCYSGHSLRAGMATSAVRGGASDRGIMDQGRWGSRTMVDRYVRNGDPWRNNVSTAIYRSEHAED